MRAKDSARLSTIRLLLAAIKQREVDERIELTDADVLGDHREDAQAAPRLDRAVREGRRARTWPTPRRPRSRCSSAYLPQQLTRGRDRRGDRRGDRRDRRRGRRRTWARSWRVLKPKLAGRADMGKVSALVKAKLSARRRRALPSRRVVAYNRNARLARASHARDPTSISSHDPARLHPDAARRVDIVDVVDRYVPLKKAGANYGPAARSTARRRRRSRSARPSSSITASAAARTATRSAS